MQVLFAGFLNTEINPSHSGHVVDSHSSNIVHILKVLSAFVTMLLTPIK